MQGESRDRRDNLLRDERIREGEYGIRHIAGVGTCICPLRTALQFFDKRKDPVAQDLVDVLGFLVSKDAPAHLLSLAALRKDTYEVRAKDRRRFFILRLHIVERLDEEQVGELFDDNQGVGHSVGIHIIPDLVDLVFECAGNQ